jgi:hypothetical protein
MRFIETDNGFVNLDYVAEIVQSETRTGTPISVLKGENGQSLGTSYLKIDSRDLDPFISAPAGYFIVYVAVDEDGCSVWQEPVIAFSVDQKGCLYPITLEGRPSGDDGTWALKRPDGQLFHPENVEHWDDEDQFKAAIIERWRAGRAVCLSGKSPARP